MLAWHLYENRRYFPLQTTFLVISILSTPSRITISSTKFSDLQTKSANHRLFSMKFTKSVYHFVNPRGPQARLESTYPLYILFSAPRLGNQFLNFSGFAPRAIIKFAGTFFCSRRPMLGAKNVLAFHGQGKKICPSISRSGKKIRA